MEKIVRSYSNNEIISDSESRKIYGCAVKFDSDSQDIGWIERISRDAITEDTIKNSDIFALLNHRDEDVLARSRYGVGSLTLELKDDGLYYEFEAPKTAKGDELLEHIKRGEISTSSFAFCLPEEDDCERWYKDEAGVLRREITRIDRLFDVSPVYEPAYLATSCDRRAKDFTDKYKDIEKHLDDLMSDIDKYKID